MPADSLDRQIWEIGLRSLRSDRPPLARGGARAKTFGAGLQQAEELWRAAERVDLVARPMLLFYGLTQAGRAICGAGSPPASWQPAESHGLAFDLVRPSSGADLDFTRISVKARGDGLIQQVARVLNSPTVVSSVTLSDLLGALDVDLIFEDSHITGPRPLEVHQYNKDLGNYGPPAFPGLIVGPVPKKFSDATEVVSASEHNLEYTRTIPPTSEELEDWLSVYPKLQSLGKPTAPNGPEPDLTSIEDGDWVIRLVWNDETHRPELTQREWTIQQLDVVYSTEFENVFGVVLPAIAGNSQPQDLLITWWLVLYCLSMVARYYPKEWAEVLDVDSSKLAVPLQQLISTAQTQVPRQILLSLLDIKGVT